MFRELLRRLRRDERGISIVEATGAATILLVGVLGTFLALDGASRHATVSERKEVAVHRAELELERVRALTYDQVGLTAAPGAPAGTDDPRSGVSGANYDSDPASAPAAEPLVIGGTGTVVPRTTWTDGRFSGTLDVFVTQVATGLKRVTVAAKLDGTERPRKPIYTATLVAG